MQVRIYDDAMFATVSRRENGIFGCWRLRCDAARSFGRCMLGVASSIRRSVTSVYVNKIEVLAGFPAPRLLD
jgi:hypothetical protein